MIESYVRHSPSALNLFAAEPAMFVLERVLGQKQIVGVPAHRGVAVEHGVTHGLTRPDAKLKHCCDVAYAKYDYLTAMSGDARRAHYRADIPAMIKQALAELRPFGPPSDTQGFLEWKPRQLLLPIVGYYDFMWANDGFVVDLKTTERMPSEIKVAHARQVSLYAMSDNIEGRLTYVTPKKCQTYRLENIGQHRQALLRLAVTVETFLSLSDSPEYFLTITAPDLDSFYWSGPAARELAYKYWRV